MKIEDINFNEMLEQIDRNAWEGRNSELYIMSDTDIVEIKGYIYEPRYESFSATHSISLNNKILFGKKARNVGTYHNEEYIFGELESEDKAIQYLKEYFKDKEISVQEDGLEDHNYAENEDEEELE